MIRRAGGPTSPKHARASAGSRSCPSRMASGAQRSGTARGWRRKRRELPEMKVMVLAAGVGSRLDPLTRCAPKPMVPVVNRPVVEHIVRLLRRHGFDDLLMNLHYLGEQIPAHLGDGSEFGVRIRYEREERLWGDAGSVRRAA